MRESSGVRIPIPVVLRQVEIFHTLGAEEREALAAHMAIRRLRAGEALFEEGDPSDGLYIVHSGEVGVVTEIGGTGRILARLGPGECFGEMSLLTGEPRSTSVIGTLDSELLFLRDEAFDSLIRRYPTVALAIGRTLSLRLRRANRAMRDEHKDRILLLVSASRRVDGIRVGAGLARALGICRGREILSIELGCEDRGEAGPGKSLRELRRAIRGGESPALSEYTVPQTGGGRRIPLSESSQDWDPRLLGPLLGLAVGQYGGVIVSANLAGEAAHIAEGRISAAIGETYRQSDAPILLVDSEEESLRRAHAFLKLTHDDPEAQDSEWRAALARPAELAPGTVETAEGRLGTCFTYQVIPEDRSSVERLARRLSHGAVGLAFGGGGARGLAHLGILEVLEESGIPIDVIGGTSIGSIISALYVSGQSPEEARKTFRREWIDKNPLTDYTFPKSALIRGRRGARVLQRVLGDLQIEDLRIPYFAVSADLVTAEEVVLSRGPLWRAVRASGSIPVLLTPVKVDGRFLVDGAVINNVPGDHLGRFGADISIAVDVTPRKDPYFEKILSKPARSGFLGRLFRRSGRVEEWLDYPGIIRTLRRIIDIEGLEIMKTKSAAFDFCIQPRLEGFDLLDFSKIDAIVEEGRRAAEDALPAIRQRYEEAARKGLDPAA